ncbi:MAG: desulfoferrodoxin [Oligosphaeraceae bacterium]|nr:desulfoferrodoxin [Oligosphaeraceae bacterium]
MENQRDQVFKCKKCGLLVEVLHSGATPHCCGEEMQLLKANTVDASKEKHVPVLSSTALGTLVEVGSVAHPMTAEHYIEWIEIQNGDYVNRLYLSPGQQPRAEFYLHRQAGLVVRAYCNLHGLWQA